VSTFYHGTWFVLIRGYGCSSLAKRDWRHDRGHYPTAGLTRKNCITRPCVMTPFSMHSLSSL